MARGSPRAPGHKSPECWHKDGKGGGQGKGKGKGKNGTGRGQSEPPPRHPKTNQPTRGLSQNKKDSQARKCNFINAGTCTNGGKCPFWHPDTCRMWLKSSCHLGNKCVFLHRGANQSAAPATPNRANSPKPPACPKAQASPKGRNSPKSPSAKKKAKAKAQATIAYCDGEHEPLSP